MTHSEILQKAIEKAVKNGYKVPPLEREVLTFRLPREYGKNNSITLWTNGWIMSHDFAKAFCKYIMSLTDDKKEELIGNLWQPYYDSWLETERHQPNYEERLECLVKDFLINMVLEEDPISYLEKFL